MPRFEENPFPEAEYSSPGIDDHEIIGEPATDVASDLAELPIADGEVQLDDLRGAAADEVETADEAESPVPPIKRVKVRSTTEVIAELEALRKMATQSMPRARSRVDSGKRRPVTLDALAPSGARRLRVSLSFEDAEGNVVQQQDESVELGESSEVDAVLIKLEIAAQKQP
jgi:hypothetical protein